VNFGAKAGGGYYAYVTSKFSNHLIVFDIDPNNDGDTTDAEEVGSVFLAGDTVTPVVTSDDTITGEKVWVNRVCCLSPMCITDLCESFPPVPAVSVPN
jgi:hypothetical protein